MYRKLSVDVEAPGRSRRRGHGRCIGGETSGGLSGRPEVRLKGVWRSPSRPSGSKRRDEKRTRENRRKSRRREKNLSEAGGRRLEGKGGWRRKSSGGEEGKEGVEGDRVQRGKRDGREGREERSTILDVQGHRPGADRIRQVQVRYKGGCSDHPSWGRYSAPLLRRGVAGSGSLDLQCAAGLPQPLRGTTGCAKDRYRST